MNFVNTCELRECFAELVEEAEEHIPLGLDLDFALMVVKASVGSLLDEEAQPSAWGVDVHYEDEVERDCDDSYSRTFQDRDRCSDTGAVAHT